MRCIQQTAACNSSALLGSQRAPRRTRRTRRGPRQPAALRASPAQPRGAARPAAPATRPPRAGGSTPPTTPAAGVQGVRQGGRSTWWPGPGRVRHPSGHQSACSAFGWLRLGAPVCDTQRASRALRRAHLCRVLRRPQARRQHVGEQCFDARRQRRHVKGARLPWAPRSTRAGKLARHARHMAHGHHAHARGCHALRRAAWMGSGSCLWPQHGRDTDRDRFGELRHTHGHAPRPPPWARTHAPRCLTSSRLFTRPAAARRWPPPPPLPSVGPRYCARCRPNVTTAIQPSSVIRPMDRTSAVQPTPARLSRLHP